MIYDNEELRHYGIKGMKWGVRRTPEQLDHRRRHEYKNTINRYKYNTFRDLSHMSDDNLKSATDRMNLEANYRTAASRNVQQGKTYISKKAKYTAAITTTAATISLVNSFMNQNTFVGANMANLFGKYKG